MASTDNDLLDVMPTLRPNSNSLLRVPTESDDEAIQRLHIEQQHPRIDSLRQTAALACKKIDIGTAVLPKPLFIADVEDDFVQIPATIVPEAAATHYARIVEQEFNAVVIEHHLKWNPLCVSEPGPLPDAQPSERFGRYDFYHADAIVDWCEQHNIPKIKGHVLIWHVTSPKFLEELEPAQVREHVKRHIYTVMGHFRGRIKMWDVCNECLAPDGSLAENVFFRKMGPGYIEECFRWAHQADPTAVLLYNDNKVEGIGTPKSEGFYNLLADLKAKNVPVHGCGLQAHFNAAGTGPNRPPTPYQVKQQIHRLGALDLTVNISELDVRVSKLPDHAIREEAQRQIYHDILAAALSEPAFDGIWLWGFSDRHTWVHSFYYDDEPCILDESYERKEAYYGVREAIASLTPGHQVGGEGVLLESDFDVNGNPWGYNWMMLNNDEGPDEIFDKAVGDARPDWERKPSSEVYDFDSGNDADVEVASGDNDDIGGDNYLPTIT